MVAGPVGGEGDGRRHHHAHEQRRRRDDGDLAGAEARPVEPHRQEGQLGAGDDEDGGEQQRYAHGKAAPLALAAHPHGRAHAAWRCSWMISANSAGSMLPPDSTAATVCPCSGELAGQDRGQRHRAARLHHQLQLAEGEAHRRLGLLVGDREAAGQIAPAPPRRSARPASPTAAHRRSSPTAWHCARACRARASGRDRRSPPARRCRSASRGSSP